MFGFVQLHWHLSCPADDHDFDGDVDDADCENGDNCDDRDANCDAGVEHDGDRDIGRGG